MMHTIIIIFIIIFTVHLLTHSSLYNHFQCFPLSVCLYCSVWFFHILHPCISVSPIFIPPFSICYSRCVYNSSSSFAIITATWLNSFFYIETHSQCNCCYSFTVCRSFLLTFTYLTVI